MGVAEQLGLSVDLSSSYSSFRLDELREHRLKPLDPSAPELEHHFPCIQLVQASRGWGKGLHLLMEEVAKPLWLYLTYHSISYRGP